MTYDKLHYTYNWDGGECPVPAGTEVHVFYKIADPDIGKASCFNWKHNDSSGHIVGFRILSLPPREIWVFEDGYEASILHEEPSEIDGPGYIKYREVQE